MSFLNLRKTKKESPISAKELIPSDKVAKKLAVVESSASAVKGPANSGVLHRPHITEKASASSERGAYVFQVSKTASKREIAQAVHLLYKVAVVKVRTVTIPSKRIIVKGRTGVRPGGKKAYVFLKPGQKIEVL